MVLILLYCKEPSTLRSSVLTLLGFIQHVDIPVIGVTPTYSVTAPERNAGNSKIKTFDIDIKQIGQWGIKRRGPTGIVRIGINRRRRTRMSAVDQHDVAIKSDAVLCECFWPKSDGSLRGWCGTLGFPFRFIF